MDRQDSFVTALADHLMAEDAGHPLRVGIDGPCGSGKSTLARDLVAVITARGRVAAHLDSDGFRNTRDIRYRRGRASARGYYEDAYNFTALLQRVLLPLGPTPLASTRRRCTTRGQADRVRSRLHRLRTGSDLRT